VLPTAAITIPRPRVGSVLACMLVAMGVQGVLYLCAHYLEGHASIQTLYGLLAAAYAPTFLVGVVFVVQVARADAHCIRACAVPLPFAVFSSVRANAAACVACAVGLTSQSWAFVQDFTQYSAAAHIAGGRWRSVWALADVGQTAVLAVTFAYELVLLLILVAHGGRGGGTNASAQSLSRWRS
jgi:hypothetical protein